MAHRASAVVTGAGSGIGAAVAGLLADDGDLDVIGIDRQWTGEPALTARLTADVSRPESVRDAFADLDARGLAPLRYLVCAAGIHHRVPTLELTHEQWSRMLAVHLDGSFLCCQQAAPRMTGRGSVVLFSSVAEFFGWPERIDYAVAKAGISAMARSLAAEWAPRGIRVNAIAPGYVDTPLIATARARGDMPFDPAAQHALGRLADAAEIARPVRFLLSDDASFVTGETLVADGGYRIFRGR